MQWLSDDVFAGNRVRSIRLRSHSATGNRPADELFLHLVRGLGGSLRTLSVRFPVVGRSRRRTVVNQWLSAVDRPTLVSKGVGGRTGRHRDEPANRVGRPRPRVCNGAEIGRTTGTMANNGVVTLMIAGVHIPFVSVPARTATTTGGRLGHERLPTRILAPRRVTMRSRCRLRRDTSRVRRIV